MLYRKQHREIGLDAPKIMILMSKIKNALAHRKNLKTALETLLHEDSYQTLAELAESLKVDHTTSNCLKVLGMTQKQEH